MPVPGVDTFIVDDSLAGAVATATDGLYLLSTAGPATPTAFTSADSGDDTLDAQLRAYFAEGGKSVTVQGYSADGVALPTLADAIAMLPPNPGQVVAPEVVTTPEHILVADGAWARNKVALLNGPGNATDTDLTTLADALVSGADARGAGLFADVAQYEGLVPNTTDSVPWTITVAGMIARNDRATGNPNLAAAGLRGISVAQGVTDPRDDGRRQTLNESQVNAAKDVYGSLRNYGFRTLADLTTLPQWWDLSGSRTVMAFRAQAAAVDESFVFDQIDGQGALLDRYESQLRAAAKGLYDLGALYGATPDDAYNVIVRDESVNPVAQLAEGTVSAKVLLKVSPYAEHLITNITRRALTATVAA